MELYDLEYYQNYHTAHGPVSHENPSLRIGYFDGIAEYIVKEYHPSTVLDAGCTAGYLVEALRKRGVAAYGIDISDDTASHLRDSAKGYCFRSSLSEDFPRELPGTYDLITCIDVLGHLTAEESGRAIRQLCAKSSMVLFSPSPDDTEEMTDVGIQRREYYKGLFAEQGFYHRLDMDCGFVSPQAILFCKSESAENEMYTYKKELRALSDENQHLKEVLTAQTKEFEDAKKEYANVLETLRESNELSDANEKELCLYRERLFVATSQREEMKKRIETLEAQYNEIQTASFWRVTKPLRRFCDFWKRLLRRNSFLFLLIKAVKSFFRSGFSVTMERAKAKTDIMKYSRKSAGKLRRSYDFISGEARHIQEEKVFDRSIMISIVVPLYNTPLRFLEKMIDSVKKQTYANWELCLADGSDKRHENVGKFCIKAAKADKRIKYTKLEKNLGISENTNACLAMSTGEYIGLLDHDDLLHPSALYEVMTAICEQGADFIYTDEATFEGSVKNIVTAHFKPDYAIDNLLANNYICHFTTFSRKTLEKAGMFRKEFDGSQDHDMILRLTEQAEKIVHIPKILYYWRSHSDSVAADINSKVYAIEAGKRAVRAGILRHGMDAAVDSSFAFPTIYRIRYKIPVHPRISIIIPNKNHYSDIKKCVDSILAFTTYDNYQILLVDNASDDTQTLGYYRLLSKRYNNISVEHWDEPFNFSAINNYAAKRASGDYLVFLNNDTEIITPEWLEELLMYAQRKDVGAVGGKLYYPDDTIQHAGIILGLGTDGVAGHCFHRFHKGNVGYMGRLYYAQDVSAVTGACMMIPRHIFEAVGGFDESFALAYNDVDLCMKIRKAGYLVVFTPYAEAYHYESKSRGAENTPEKQTRFRTEVNLFREKWAKELADGDPYYNPNLTLERGDFSLRVY